MWVACAPAVSNLAVMLVLVRRRRFCWVIWGLFCHGAAVVLHMEAGVWSLSKSLPLVARAHAMAPCLGKVLPGVKSLFLFGIRCTFLGNIRMCPCLVNAMSVVSVVSGDTTDVASPDTTISNAQQHKCGV